MRSRMAMRRRTTMMTKKRERRMLERRLTLYAAPAALVLGLVFATLHDNSLARTPPMGWNSWNHFGCDVSAQLIRETADAMVASGMKDAGYRYVVIDDCWQVARDAK